MQGSRITKPRTWIIDLQRREFTKDETDTLNYLADEIIGKKEEEQKKTKIQGKSIRSQLIKKNKSRK